MKRKLFRWGVVIVAIGIAFFVYRYVNDRLAFSRIDQGGQPQSARQYMAYEKDLVERYQNDSYGSTTPEGTLELFVAALKKEDVSLASNYFVPEKRVKMKEDLKAGLKSGGVKTLVDLLNQNKKGYSLAENRYEVDTFGRDNTAEYGFILILNKYTQKWLIESL
jgi:hypothetical protein